MILTRSCTGDSSAYRILYTKTIDYGSCVRTTYLILSVSSHIYSIPEYLPFFVFFSAIVALKQTHFHQHCLVSWSWVDFFLKSFKSRTKFSGIVLLFGIVKGIPFFFKSTKTRRTTVKFVL